VGKAQVKAVLYSALLSAGPPSEGRRSMKLAPKTPVSARGLRVLVLRSAFNANIVEGLVAGALGALEHAGASGVEVVEVPGAFELPLAARVAARSGAFGGIVALGAVVRGETDHYEHVAREAASGLAAVARETGVPVAFGVLTVSREEQALARCAPGPDNKGAEAARAVLASVASLREIRRLARGPRRAPAGRS
jgi:6,7-dimethyl-8-ribityllumazine synthase